MFKCTQRTAPPEASPEAPEEPYQPSSHNRACSTTMSDDDDVDGRAPTGPARTKTKARLVEGYKGVQFMMDTSYAARPYQVRFRYEWKAALRTLTFLLLPQFSLLLFSESTLRVARLRAGGARAELHCNDKLTFPVIAYSSTTGEYLVWIPLRTKK